MNKISVIIPCCNVERWIDRCMTSITSQTIGMGNLEIICVDDASADDTWGHLKEWERSFPENVRLIQLEVNLRQGAARNIGLRYASADWIAFVDADDWVEPDYFELLYTAATNHICDVVVCGSARDCSLSLTYFKEEERDDREDQYILVDTREKKKEMLLYKPLNVFSWAKIIRKKMLLEHQIYFPEGLVYEDNYWHPLLHVYADNIYVIGKRLYHYFMRASSTVNAQNQPHHLDRITVELIKWEDYGKRGLLKIYQEEFEYDLIQYAVYFMQTLVFRYDQPSYSYYRLQQEVVRQRISDNIMDRYVGVFSGLQGILFEMLYHSLDKAGFEMYVQQARYYAMNENVKK